jgi:hypothetical protein
VWSTGCGAGARRNSPVTPRPPPGVAALSSTQAPGDIGDRREVGVVLASARLDEFARTEDLRCRAAAAGRIGRTPAPCGMLARRPTSRQRPVALLLAAPVHSFGERVDGIHTGWQRDQGRVQRMRVFHFGVSSRFLMASLNAACVARSVRLRPAIRAKDESPLMDTARFTMACAGCNSSMPSSRTARRRTSSRCASSSEKCSMLPWNSRSAFACVALARFALAFGFRALEPAARWARTGDQTAHCPPWIFSTA